MAMEPVEVSAPRRGPYCLGGDLNDVLDALPGCGLARELAMYEREADRFVQLFKTDEIGRLSGIVVVEDDVVPFGDVVLGDAGLDGPGSFDTVFPRGLDVDVDAVPIPRPDCSKTRSPSSSLRLTYLTTSG